MFFTFILVNDPLFNIDLAGRIRVRVVLP
jgi:hypothetical protein